MEEETTGAILGPCTMGRGMAPRSCAAIEEKDVSPGLLTPLQTPAPKWTFRLLRPGSAKLLRSSELTPLQVGTSRNVVTQDQRGTVAFDGDAAVGFGMDFGRSTTISSRAMKWTVAPISFFRS